MSQRMSPIRKDFFASQLRSKVKVLQTLLSGVEEEDYCYDSYTVVSLKEVEAGIKHIRRFMEAEQEWKKEEER